MRISDWSSDVCSSDLRAAGWQSPWRGDRRNAMTGATPLPLYAIGLGSNRRHGRFGDPRRVLLAALAAPESAGIEPVDASPIISSAPDRMNGVWGTSVAGREELVDRRIQKKKKI